MIFVAGGFGHFSRGAPLANILVPVSGVIPIVGVLGVLLGFHGKLGAWFLVLFLIPLTFMMHNRWAVKDPMAQGLQMVIFLQNVSVLGAAVFFTQTGTGPLSLDSRSGPAR